MNRVYTIARLTGADKSVSKALHKVDTPSQHNKQLTFKQKVLKKQLNIVDLFDTVCAFARRMCTFWTVCMSEEAQSAHTFVSGTNLRTPYRHSSNSNSTVMELRLWSRFSIVSCMIEVPPCCAAYLSVKMLYFSYNGNNSLASQHLVHPIITILT